MKFDQTRVHGSCRKTFQVGTILISPRVLIQFEVNLGDGAHCKRKRKPRRTANFVLHSLDPCPNKIEEQIQGGRSCVHYKAVETRSRRRLLDPSG